MTTDTSYYIVILSEAKDLLFRALTRKQVPRFAQDHNPYLYREFEEYDTKSVCNFHPSETTIDPCPALAFIRTPKLSAHSVPARS